MKKSIVLAIVLLAVSCRSTKNTSYSDARNLYVNYVVNHNTSSLKKSYKLLLDNIDFQTKGIQSNNIDIVIPVFLKMEKYDQLITLLNNNKVLSNYQTEFYLNYTNAMKYRCKNSEKFNVHIHNNLNLVEKQIHLHPEDSTLLVDYYLNKLFISDIDYILKEVDSLKISDRKFSPDFYEVVLKDAVKQSSNDIAPCK